MVCKNKYFIIASLLILLEINLCFNDMWAKQIGYNKLRDYLKSVYLEQRKFISYNL